MHQIEYGLKETNNHELALKDYWLNIQIWKKKLTMKLLY